MAMASAIASTCWALAINISVPDSKIFFALSACYAMVLYEVELRVREVRGRCPLYRGGEVIVLKGFYIDSKRSAPVCIHAFLAMSSLLSAFSHGADATDLGIGKEKDVGCLLYTSPSPRDRG